MACSLLISALRPSIVRSLSLIFPSLLELLKKLLRYGLFKIMSPFFESFDLRLQFSNFSFQSCNLLILVITFLLPVSQLIIILGLQVADLAPRKMIRNGLVWIDLLHLSMLTVMLELDPDLVWFSSRSCTWPMYFTSKLFSSLRVRNPGKHPSSSATPVSQVEVFV